MSTSRLLKQILTEGSIISYSVTNAALYVEHPATLLKMGLDQLARLIETEDNKIEDTTTTAISYAIIGVAAVCLAIQNYQSYSKIVREYDQVQEEKSADLTDVLVDNPEEPAIVPPKRTCNEKFRAYTSSLLKTVGASYSWYSLVNQVPFQGASVVAAITTAASVPGNIHSQNALLSKKK